MTICNISYFPFGFEGWIWVLIAGVSDLCILITSVMATVGFISVYLKSAKSVLCESSESHFEIVIQTALAFRF